MILNRKVIRRATQIFLPLIKLYCVTRRLSNITGVPKLTMWALVMHLVTFGATQLVMSIVPMGNVNIKKISLIGLSYSLLWRNGITKTDLWYILCLSLFKAVTLLPRKVSSRVWSERAAEISAIWFCNPVLIKENPLLLAKSAKIAWKRHQGHKI